MIRLQNSFFLAVHDQESFILSTAIAEQVIVAAYIVLLNIIRPDKHLARAFMVEDRAVGARESTNWPENLN